MRPRSEMKSAGNWTALLLLIAGVQVSYGVHKNQFRTIRNDVSGPSNDSSSTVTVLIAAFSFVVLTVFLSSIVISFIFCYCCHKRSRRDQCDQELENGHAPMMANFGSGDMCEAIIPQGESIQSLMVQSAKHGSQCSAPSELIQRAVVRHTKLIKTVEKGIFCDVHVGQWRTEHVSVKVYLAKDKKLWFAESQIFQVPYMRHESILGFVAADTQQRSGVLHHFVITDYHEQGTLRMLLKRTVVDVNDVIQLAFSLAKGISHLHMEQVSGTTVKLAMAHRNISSSSIYIKSDGSCCIGDLCFAVKDDSNLSTEVQSRPLQCYRYLAPEYLSTETPQVTIDNLRKADMYSYGLVLWELSRRCAIQGMVEDTLLPYADHLTNDTPSLEEMREIACINNIRPAVSDQWNRDESMRLILRTMTECWHRNSSARLTALRVRKTLEKLAASVKPYYDKNGRVILTEIDRAQFHS